MDHREHRSSYRRLALVVNQRGGAGKLEKSFRIQRCGVVYR
jgi:hypothetical protein